MTVLSRIESQLTSLGRLSLDSYWDIASLVAAGAVAVFVFVISKSALRQFELGNPVVLSLCIAVLTFFGVVPYGRILLILFATFGCVAVLVTLIRVRTERDVAPRSDTQSQQSATPLRPFPSRQSKKKNPSSSNKQPQPENEPIVPLDIPDDEADE